jgi:hypothetical protein
MTAHGQGSPASFKLRYQHMERNTVFPKITLASFFPILAVVLAVVLGATSWADELRVRHWPDDVPCSSLQHKTDGTWALADEVVGPDGDRHYPNPDRDSYDNRFFTGKCNKCAAEKYSGVVSPACR